MDGSVPDLSALQDFVLVVDHGGFGRASRATGRSKATLSRRISELEAGLGVRLFERGARVTKLTEAGLSLHGRIAAPLGDILDATEAASSGASRPGGRLRVGTPILFGHIAMGALACAFAALYPEIRLEVLATDRLVDPVEDDVDVVIRVNPRPDERLTGRRFMTDRLLAVSVHERPVFSASHGGDRAPLPTRAVVLNRSPEQTVWELDSEAGRLAIEPIPCLRFSSILMVRDAVYRGAGAALLPRSMVAEDLDTRRLRCWGELVDYDIELWVLHNSRRLVSRKVSAFVEFLTASYRNAERE